MRAILAGIDCPVHHVPTAVTQSGLQHVCVQPDCEFHVRLQGPQKAETIMSPKTPPAVPADPATRKKLIDEAIAKKKAAAKPADPPAKPKVDDPPAKKKDKVKPAPQQKADAELDSNVAKKPKKVEEDADMMSVSDVAREAGIDPKRARAKLRAAGQAATEGRWPKVKRGSKKHQELMAILAPEPAEDEEDEEEETENDEEEGDESDDE